MNRIIYISLLLACNSLYAMCMTESGRFDLECSCTKSNNCFSVVNKELKKEVAVTAKQIGKDKAKKLYKSHLPQLKKIDQLFSNQLDIKNLDFEVYETKNKKLEKINKKLEKYVEKTLKKNGAKTIKIDIIKKKINSFFQKSIPDHVLKNVEKKGIDMNSISNNLNKASNKKESDTELISTDKDIDEVTKSLNDSNDISVYDSNSIENQKKNIQSKRFKVNSLHSKETNLWNVLSLRYQRISNRLIISKAELAEKRKTKKNTLKSIDDLIDLY